MFLTWSNLDIMRSDCRLVLIRVIEPLDVVKITDVKSCNVVCSCQSEIEETAVLADIGAVIERKSLDIKPF
jgi:hypothetical protein